MLTPLTGHSPVRRLAKNLKHEGAVLSLWSVGQALAQNVNCQLRGYLGLIFSFVKTLPADILVCLVLILADSLQQVVKDPELDPVQLKQTNKKKNINVLCSFKAWRPCGKELVKSEMRQHHPLLVPMYVCWDITSTKL